MRYHHPQLGTFMLAVLLIGAAAIAIGGYFGVAQRVPLWVLSGFLVVLAVVFSSLTVDVDEAEVRWHFGPGLWHYRIARSDIAAVQIVRNSWMNGFGIRMRPGFRLYNVSGLDAVELRLKNGDVRRVGTDDAQAFAAALGG